MILCVFAVRGERGGYIFAQLAKIWARLRQGIGGNNPPDYCVELFKSLKKIKITTSHWDVVILAE